MKQDDVDLYRLLNAAKRNAILSGQGQNSVTTDMHIGTTQHLIEQAISIIKNRETSNPVK